MYTMQQQTRLTVLSPFPKNRAMGVPMYRHTAALTLFRALEPLDKWARKRRDFVGSEADACLVGV